MFEMVTIHAEYTFFILPKPKNFEQLVGAKVIQSKESKFGNQLLRI